MMLLTNTAAYLVAEKARPLQVQSAPIIAPGENQILIKNYAIAINPLEHKLQAEPPFVLTYPAILGTDVAGEVVKVGPNVRRFQTGDRVLGCAAGFDTHKAPEMAYQAYTVLETNMTSHIPDGLSYDRAVVLPLGISTAAAGLFESNLLNLRLPIALKHESAVVESLLVWGGASSVGGCAIQLAVAAGYEVLTTASPINFQSMRELGASHVFDYRSPTVVADLVAAAEGKNIVGVFDAIGANEGVGPSVQFLRETNGVKLVATTLPKCLFSGSTEGVAVKYMFSLAIKGSNIGQAIWGDFLPKALESGSFVVWPEPLVFGEGLQSLQGAMDHLAQGVSAQKVVVRL